ncbi:MAG: hypothetical protein QME81_20205, partial [bacterium]|nr:hypothetical protein [bacterium]
AICNPKLVWLRPEAALSNGVNDGYSSLESILRLVHNKQIRILPLTEAEVVERTAVPHSFGAGELDSLVICKHRKLLLVTNDKRVTRFCENKGIRYIALNALLRMLWKNSILAKEEVKDLIEEIEKKDRVSILRKDDILTE